MALLLLLLNDKNEKIQLPINANIVMAVSSSIIVVSLIFNIFSEVKTTKQIPSKLDDAFKIWGDFSVFIHSEFIGETKSNQ